MIRSIIISVIMLFILMGIGHWMDDHGWISGSVTSPSPNTSKLDDACATLVAKAGGTCKVIAHDP